MDPHEFFEEHVGECKGERVFGKKPQRDKTQAIANTIEGGLAELEHGGLCKTPVDEATFRVRIAICGECPRSRVRLHTLRCGLCYQTLRSNPMLAEYGLRSEMSCKDPDGDRWQANHEN